jgi:hypothetical protein
LPGKNILLIEPAYKNKYPPLGLMKLAQYHGPQGKRDNVVFVKGEDPSVLATAWDRIYVTTLFSFEFAKISRSIDYAITAANGHRDKVFVGGIAASLMHDRFLAEDRWIGVRFIKGLLAEPPATALKLDDFSGELYSDDVDSRPIEDLTPDYSILDQISYKYPVCDAYFVYASRGCIRSCNFCGVPKLEGKLKETESIASIVRDIEQRYGPKKDLILMDNNVVAAPNFKEIIAEIRDLGFTPGAKLQRGRFALNRRVDFNQGVDARILCKDPMYLRELASIAIKPLRIAFDHWGLQKPYEQAIRFAHEFGLNELSNYMLYNFHDSPNDLYLRMNLNVSLNEELGIRIYSFPMRYQPTDLPHRTYVSEKWTRYQLRSLQIILQATHGVVSGEPDFFRLAFGENGSQFADLLLRPQHFIFNREYFDRYEGRAELDCFNAEFSSLSRDEREELVNLLSSSDPSEFVKLASRTANSKLRSILRYYVAPSKHSEARIWEMQRARALAKIMPALPAEETVEDAGLDEDYDDGATVPLANKLENSEVYA